MVRSGLRPSIRRTAGLAAVAALLAAALSSCATQAQSPGAGVITFAEQAGTPPTYISPLMSAEHESNANLYQFSNFLYLPLYWFGGNGQPKLNETLSVAYPPVFSNNDTVATVNLKHWKWSNGTPITARDVMFWMNLLSAVTDPNAPPVGSASSPGPGWFASVPGGFPENVISYTQTGTYSLQFKMNASYNPTWVLFNELSQVYPLPQAEWDKLSASGSVGNYDTSAAVRTAIPGTTPASYLPAHPGTANSGALGVAAFINDEASNITTYASNPFWKTVDGPFTLTQFTPEGYAKFVPNKSYSGTPKPTIKAFIEEPFTTNLAEFNALRTGSLTIGYLPSEDYNQRTSLATQEKYNLNPWYLFGFVYAGLNFTSPTVGPMFRQLYFRQALQSLINQKQWINQFNDGQGTVDNGPVPTYPPNNADESSLEATGQVYPYDPTKAVSLLTSHGWKVTPGGTTYCSNPGTGSGQCGAGITSGQQTNFTMILASGNQEATNEMDSFQSTLKSVAGIGLTITQEPFATVIGTMDAGCTYTTPCTNWDMANWIGGWSYDPDFFPTGEEIFQTGAGSNVGDYSNPTNDANIVATTTAANATIEHSALVKYQNFLAVNLPGLYLPNVPQQFTMYKSNLKGFLPQDVYDILYPQDYSLG
ncbi:MAG TPA: ABC transporter substrate-binding protein [Candidatus Dormibacteraeota bacterium]|nr:ABC transporter substrate-binding protein [Candidatus Dormibacteraeota bacterium]